MGTKHLELVWGQNIPIVGTNHSNCGDETLSNSGYLSALNSYPRTGLYRTLPLWGRSTPIVRTNAPIVGMKHSHVGTEHSHCVGTKHSHCEGERLPVWVQNTPTVGTKDSLCGDEILPFGGGRNTPTVGTKHLEFVWG